jgi:hypothetical protein
MEFTLKQVKSALEDTLAIITITPNTCLCCKEQFSKESYSKMQAISQKYFGHDHRMLQRHFFEENLKKLMPEALSDGQYFCGFELSKENGSIIATIASKKILWDAF